MYQYHYITITIKLLCYTEHKISLHAALGVPVTQLSLKSPTTPLDGKVWYINLKLLLKSFNNRLIYKKLYQIYTFHDELNISYHNR